MASSLGLHSQALFESFFAIRAGRRAACVRGQNGFVILSVGWSVFELFGRSAYWLVASWNGSSGWLVGWLPGRSVRYFIQWIG